MKNYETLTNPMLNNEINSDDTGISNAVIPPAIDSQSYKNIIAKFPGVPVTPLPSEIVAVTCTVAGVGYKLIIPNNVLLCKFEHNGGVNVIANIGVYGNEMALTGVDGGDSVMHFPFYGGNGPYFEVFNNKQFNVSCPVAGTIVFALCWKLSAFK